MTANTPPPQAQETQLSVPNINAATVGQRHNVPYIPKKRGSNWTAKYNTPERLKKRKKRKAQNRARQVRQFYSKPQMWTTYKSAMRQYWTTYKVLRHFRYLGKS